MKILYISHHQEESGYGRWCKSFLDALKTTNLEIASYAVKLGKAREEYKDETENNSLYNPDIVIQNILPHLMSKCQQPCVGGAILETKNVYNNPWGQHLEMMDQVWYPHYPLDIFSHEVEIPTAINIDKYTKEYPKLNISEADGTFKFLWIGELSKRKNLSGLIKAYYNTFSHSDPVSLIIKAHKQNFDPQSCQKELNELIYSIANGCKLYDKLEDYPRIIPVCDYWPKEKIYGLHKYADCYVSSSYGEAINYPLLDALGFNKPVLSTNTFATETYAKYGLIKLSFSDENEYCFGQIDTFPFYQTSKESWPSFNQKDFGRQMYNLYIDRPKFKNDLSSLSFKNTGKLIKEQLIKIINKETL